jgi:hypothetical protein
MGLDMYARSRSNPEDRGEEIFYWRKHPAIHSWMEAKALEKNPDLDFNGEVLILSKEDIIQLEENIIANALTYEAKGFFWGASASPGDEDFDEERKNDLNFCARALREIEKGNEVYYYASY